MIEASRVDQLLAWARRQLEDLDTAAIDAELLLAETLGRDRTWLFTWPEHQVCAVQIDQFRDWIKRRREGEPVAYLIGRRHFWTFELDVSPATLIPRPETECLIDCALSLDLPEKARVLDLGTGTGAIALALASERPDWQILAVEFQPQAYQLACQNRDRLGLSVDILLGSWFDPLPPGVHYDLILSNPPYVESGSSWLEQGDVRFEPRSALISGPQGLDDLRAIIDGAPDWLAGGGYLMLEHGCSQAGAVRDLLQAGALSEVETRQDLAGLDRFSLARMLSVGNTGA